MNMRQQVRILAFIPLYLHVGVFDTSEQSTFDGIQFLGEQKS